MDLTFYSFVSIIAIFQAFLMSVFFFLNKKGLRSSNVILGTLLGLYGFYLIFLLLVSRESDIRIFYRYPALWLLFELNYCFGPLLYFYTQSTIDGLFRFRLKNLMHFIPFLITASVVSTVLLHWYDLPWFFWWDQKIVVLHLALYLVASMLLARSRIKSPFSSVDDIRLAWLRFLFLSYFVMVGTRIFVSLSIYLGWRELFIFTRFAHMGFIFIFFNVTALLALLKPELFSFIVRYHKSVLKESDKDLYKQKLIDLMEKDKPYLEPGCTLPSLAKKLSIPVPYLSQLVNETFHLSFPDFINRYRIEESKKFIYQISENNMTILEIAYNVGFYSKSSFNAAFKRHTGHTPKEYKNQVAV